jgi:histidine triad (HIT) family protein
MNDCVFCKMIKGEIPCDKIYEDRNVLAFLDIKPINYGHALLIHKHHKKNLLEMSDQELFDLMRTIKKVAAAVKVGMHADAFNIGMNNGEASGQVVHHAHIHIIPRFKNDGLKSWTDKDYKQGEIKEYARKIKSAMR